MTRTNLKHVVAGATLTLLFGAASTARAQSSASDSPWSLDFGIGSDIGISGQINSSGIGKINNQVVVVTNNS